MDFTPDLTAFQGIIISADNVHSFSRLTSKGGNEQKIEYVISSLRKFLEDRQCITNTGIVEEKNGTMRKFALFLVFNTDFPSLEQMVDKEGIDLVIWTLPTISQYLLSEMFWHLHMEKFVYEIIAFSCPQLALEVAQSLVDNMKYFTPQECLEKLNIVASASYKLVCRLHFFNFENDVMSKILTLAFNTFHQCINFFTAPPNAWKLESLSKDDKYKFTGNCLKKILLLISECMQQYTSVQAFAPFGFDDIYQLTYKVGSYKEDTLPFNVCNSPNKPLLECLDTINEILLDKCKEIVMEVSVDIFCAWSEFDDNGRSMQEVIGEMCFKLRSNLQSVNIVAEHPVVSMIEQISRKPMDVQEVVNSSDTDTIMENINMNDNNRASWTSALLNKDKLCEDDVLVQHLASNVRLLTQEECHKLYNICKNHLKENPGANNIEMLSVRAFQQCSTAAKHKILEERFIGNCFCDMKKNTKFNNMMTEIFNKVIANDIEDLSDVLCLFLQSPQKVYAKIFELAAENTQQTEIMLKTMMVLKEYSNHFYNDDTEACVVRAAQKALENCLETEAKQQNIVKYVSSLKQADIIPGPKLLLLIIMPSLHKALLNKDIFTLNIQCKLLSEAFSMEELAAYRAPMLAMLAQILDAVRWKMNTFVASAPSTLELALRLQNTLFSSYGTDIPEKEANWLKSKLKIKRPLNLYYYRRLWKPSGDNFIEIVSGKKIHSAMDPEELYAWLSYVLCSTTQKEWFDIWDSLHCFGNGKTLDIFHDALSILTVTEEANRKQNTWECILQCYRNFIYVIRYKFLKEPLSNEHVSAVVLKIALSVSLMKSKDIKDIGTVVMPIFVYMMEKNKEHSVNVMKRFNNKSKHPKFAELMSVMFTHIQQ